VTTDADFMALALREARRAARRGEVPVGAVIVGPGPSAPSTTSPATAASTTD
jgi:tRNA(Arg) A34 adenosine deaminase TadA